MKARGTVCRPLPGEPGLAQDAFWREQRDLAAPPLGQRQMRGERRDRPELETVERQVAARRGSVARIVVAEVEIGGRARDTVLRDERERTRVELVVCFVFVF